MRSRTPLNAVIGMANLLSDTHLNPEQETYVQDVKHAADVLHGLISDILDLSKIEAGQMEVAPSLVNIHQTVFMMCRTMRVKAEENGNQLNYFIDEKVPQTIRLDRNILNQVLLNLIGNSIKFTRQRYDRSSYRCKTADNGECLLKAKIIDTGIGIPESKLPEIFEKFKQAEGRNTHKRYGGTGLGLPICKKLVELHGGSIQVESEKEKGSTFHLNSKPNWRIRFRWAAECNRRNIWSLRGFWQTQIFDCGRYVYESAIHTEHLETLDFQILSLPTTARKQLN